MRGIHKFAIGCWVLATVLYLFAGYGFLIFVQKMALAFCRDWLTEWWAFKKWWREDHPVRS